MNEGECNAFSMTQSISKKKRGKEDLHPFLQLVGSSLQMEIVILG